MQYNACVDKDELSGSGEELRGWGWLVGRWVGWGVRQTAAGGGRGQEGGGDRRGERTGGGRGQEGEGEETEGLGGGGGGGQLQEGGVSDGAVTRRT